MEEKNLKDLLKQMGKREMVRLLEKSEEENSSYRQQIRGLQETVEQQDKQLSLAKLKQSMPGSLADSVAEANGVMLTAQKTANVYLEQIQKLMDLKAQEAADIISAAKQEAEQILAKAEQEKQRIERSCVDILDTMQRDVDNILHRASEDYKRSLSAEQTETPVSWTAAAEDAPGGEEEAVSRQTVIDEIYQSLVTSPEQGQVETAE